MTDGEGTLFGMIESILFVAGEAVDVRDLARALRIGEDELENNLEQLSDEYDFNQRGFMLIRFGSKVQLATDPRRKMRLQPAEPDDQRPDTGNREKGYNRPSDSLRNHR